MYEIPHKVQDEEKKAKLVPFKVHFANKILHGKSSVRPGLPQGIPHIVAEKFYKKDNSNISTDAIEKMNKELKTLNPQEKYTKSVTENQCYGWYHDVEFSDMNRTDSRLYFGRRMDHFIKMYLLTLDKKSIRMISNWYGNCSFVNMYKK